MEISGYFLNVREHVHPRLKKRYTSKKCEGPFYFWEKVKMQRCKKWAKNQVEMYEKYDFYHMKTYDAKKSIDKIKYDILFCTSASVFSTTFLNVTTLQVLGLRLFLHIFIHCTRKNCETKNTS